MTTMTTHDDDALAEARALLENASIDDLQIMSCDGDRVQIADQHGDWFGELDYTQPEDATLVIDAPRLLRALADECDALRAERDAGGVPLRLEIDADDTYILSDPLTLRYGAGATPRIAFDEWLASLDEFAALLKGQPDIVAEFWRRARETGADGARKHKEEYDRQQRESARMD